MAAGVLVATSTGYSGSSVDSTEQSVWVTNNAQYLVGRVNRQIDELDSAALVDGTGYDLLQDGHTVIVVDPQGHRMRTLDPATVSLSSPIDLPGSAEVVLGGSTVGVADTATGAVWLGQVGELDGGAVADSAPAVTAAPGLAIAAGPDGSVAVAAPGASTLTVVGPDGTPHQQRLAGPALPAATATDQRPVDVTMVGATAVVLDRVGNRILVGDKTFPLPRGAVGPVLQHSGPATDAVLVATRDALLRLSLVDGSIQTFTPGVTGSPAAPVWLNGCANGAWGGDHPTYLGWCGSVPTIRQLPSATAGDTLVFGVNRDQMVLNDVVTGTVWVTDHAMAVINNWTQVAPQQNQDSQQAPDADTGKSDDLTLSRTDCTKGAAAPSARPDSFGVRAGHPTVLPVMDNDAVSDCSVSVVDQVDATDADGAVQIVDGGRALQITPPAGASGALPAIGYRISDGQGHSATGKVAVNVVPAGTWLPPKKVRASAMVIASGGSASHDVLADWISPSGDALFLTGATLQGAASEGSGTSGASGGSQPGDQSGADTLSYASDGTITLRDSGSGGPAKKSVMFVVSDGVNTAQGTLTVDVVADANLVPVPSPVYARTVVGRPVTVAPLATVLSVGSDPLRLSAVTPPAGTPALHVQTDLDGGTVSVDADSPGTYYLGFQVTAGSQPANGVIRVDVAAGGDTGAAPTAVGDLAFLAPGGSARVDLTANDTDPDAGVLAVQQVSLAPSSPLQVRLVDMHLAEITSRRALPPEGAWFSYVVASGPATGATSTGWVHVVPVSATPAQSPITPPLSLTVRAGDAVTRSITGAALDPGGSALTVADFDPLPAGSGVLFGSGDTIRYLAPAAGLPRPLHTTYTVVNEAGRTDTAPLTIRVVPSGSDHPPRTPPVVTARVFAGARVDIALPLDGLDPDGDWVTASAIDPAPTAGTARVVGPSTVSYTAPGTPGTYTVGYTVIDPSGQSATGTVIVGVIAPPDLLQPPVAPALQVDVRPGRSVGVDVLSAVTDPAGYAVQFAPDALGDGVPAGGSAGVTATIADGMLVVTAGSRNAVVPISYTVVNSRGLSATGVVTVTVDPNARPVPPTATDVYVGKDMLIAGGSGGSAALVDVSSAVGNPGGLLSELAASVPAGDGPGIVAAGALRFRVAITGGRQVFAYQVRNAAGSTASAFIVVPAASELLPANGLPGNGQDRTSAPQVPTAPPTQTAPPTPTAPPQGTARTSTLAPTTTAPAPTLASRPLQLAPGQQATIDLAALVSPATVAGRSLTFAGPGGAGSGVSATLAGSKLTVRAGLRVPDGTTVPLTVSVTDGHRPPASGTIAVTVRLDADPPTVPDVTVEGRAGQTTSVNVLRNAINPLSAQGPLTLVDAKLAGGSAGLDFVANGAISVTPSRSGTDTVTVAFTIADPTRRPDRMVTGYLTVVVLGLPGTPGAPSVVSSGDGSVVLKWLVPDDHGSPITSYQVSGGERGPTSCPQSPCTIGGLTNGRTYRFTVAARNGVGDSPASAPSGPVRPDVAPDSPDAPTLAFGDRTITATWKPPTNHGSAITGYRLSISPAPATGKPTVATAAGVTTYQFVGLTNGTAYQITAVAVNGSGTPSDPSPPATAVPAAKPGVPAAPTVSSASDAGSGGQVRVSWTQVDGHGDNQITYTVHWSGGNGSQGTIQVPPGKPLTATITGITLGVTYSATVAAANKAGSSGPGPAGTVSPYTAPSRIDDLTATPTGNAGEVRLAWSAPADGGRPITAYQYHDGDGQWKAVNAGATSLTVGGLTNGTTYGFVVRACNTDAANNCGPDSKPAPASPYQPPGPPQNLAANAAAAPGQLVLSWSAPASAGGRPVAGYQYTLAGSGTWTDAGATTSVRLTGLSNGQSYRYQVRAYTAAPAGRYGSPATVTATPYGVPGTPSGLTATGGPNTITLSFSAPASDGGRAISGYQYSMDGGAWTGIRSGGAVAVGNWSRHRFVVRAVNQRGPGAATGAVAASAYGPAPAVTAVASGAGGVKFTWSGPSGGSGRYRVDGGGATAARSVTRSPGCGKTASISVVALDAAGNPSRTGTVTGRAKACAPPPAAAQLVHGASISNSQCDVDCYYFKVNYQNLKAGSYAVKLYLDGAVWRTYTWSLGSNGSEQATSYAGKKSGRTARIVLTGPSGTVDTGTRAWP